MVNTIRNDESGQGRVFYLLLALVAVAGLAWLLVARGGGDGGPLPSLDELASVEADPASGVALGAADAPVTIWEFADMQCPHCAQFAGFTGRLLRQNYVENGGPVRWVVYDFVLGNFPHSVPASLSARCAGDQGRYWPMHDLILARQNRWAQEDRAAPVFREFAAELGLDLGEYDACIREQRHLRTLAAARAYGDQLGVNSTPTLFLNGRRLAPQETTYEAIEALILAAVDSAAAAAAAMPESD